MVVISFSRAYPGYIMVRILPRMPWSKKPSEPRMTVPRPILWIGIVVIVLVAIWLLVSGPANKPLPEVTPIISPAPALQSLSV